MTQTKLNVSKVVAWYNAHGQNASKTAKHFKVSRQTVHTYLNKIAKVKSPLNKKRKRNGKARR